MKPNYQLLITNLCLLIILAACAPAATATQDPNIALTAAFGTAFAQISQPSQTPAPSNTPAPTATIPHTPAPLPPTFQTAAITSGATPHTYLTDSCQYLKDKWSSKNSAPGTIVMVIMFHGINKDSNSVDENDISVQDFKKLMNNLKDLGFEAINATQLADFLDTNAYIPPRAVVLTYDDRHFASAYDHFRPYHEKWGWPVINGWISAFGGQDNVLAENVALEKEGWVDHQAHGVVHNTPMGDSSPDSYIQSELQGSIDTIQKYYGKKPIAIIWPGGGFGLRPVQVARQLGYRVGFTVNPRGPFMFNWIPLTDQPTGQYDIAEGPAGDPRLTLPRYWPSQAISQLDTIRVIGNDAAAYAQQNKAAELDYYNVLCAPTYGALP